MHSIFFQKSSYKEKLYAPSFYSSDVSVERLYFPMNGGEQ